MSTKMPWEEKAAILRAIGHPVRFHIVKLLLEAEGKGEWRVKDIWEHLNRSEGEVSYHMILMRHKKVLTSERVGTTVYYKVANPMAREIMKVFL